jgi:hypothetical protein
MPATKASLASGGMIHCFWRWGLTVFFLASARSHYRWRAQLSSAPPPPLPAAAAATARAPWRFGAGQRDHPALSGSIEDALSADAGECLRVSTASKPSSTGYWWFRATVPMLVSGAAAIRLSLHPSPAPKASAFIRMRAFTNWHAQCLPLPINVLSCSQSLALRFTSYYFAAICFAVVVDLRRCGAIDSEILTTASDVAY